jgi:hypothetical protein
VCGGCKRVMDALRNRVPTNKRRRRQAQHDGTLRATNKRLNAQSAAVRRALVAEVRTVQEFRGRVGDVLNKLPSELRKGLRQLLEKTVDAMESPLLRDPELLNQLLQVCPLLPPTPCSTVCACPRVPCVRALEYHVCVPSSTVCACSLCSRPIRVRCRYCARTRASTTRRTSLRSSFSRI